MMTRAPDNPENISMVIRSDASLSDTLESVDVVCENQQFQWDWYAGGGYRLPPLHPPSTGCQARPCCALLGAMSTATQ